MPTKRTAPRSTAPASITTPPAAASLRLQLAGSIAPPSADWPATPGLGPVRRRRIELGARRDGGAAPVTLEVAADEVVRVELDDGLVWWTRADDLLREHGAPVAGRGGAGGAPVWSLEPGLSPARGGAAQRGLASMAIKALEFAGVDVSAMAARKLGELAERKRLGHAPGLYQLSLDDGPLRYTAVLADQRLPGGDAPLLVFLHGTLSSHAGSFGGLWRHAGDAGDDTTAEELQAAQQARAALRAVYGERVYALEHFTLSQSPVANALALARALPAASTAAPGVAFTRWPGG